MSNRLDISMDIKTRRKYYYTILILSILIVLNVFCNKAISTDPEDETVYHGRIFINSIPSGANIILNGKDTGKLTPDTLKWLKEEHYNIILRMSGFRDSSFQVYAIENQVTSLSIDFTKNPLMYGNIICSSDPESSEIYLNGIYTGKVTPDTIKKLFPGNYIIRFSKVGYRSDSIEIRVTSNNASNAYLKLTDTTLWVIFNKSNSPLTTNYINCIAIDKQNKKCIGTDGGGLYLFDDNEWINYTSGNSGLPDDKITAILPAENGLWIGTKSYGLVYFVGNEWANYNSSNSFLTGDFITALALDDSENIWIGTYNKGLFKFKNNVWENFNTNNSGLKSDFITSLYSDEGGSLWIGTNNKGIFIYENNSWKELNKIFPNLPLNISSISNCENVMYVGSNTGLYKYENDIWASVQPVFSNLITTLAVDAKNNLWVGSKDLGVSLIEGIFIFRDKYSRMNSQLPYNYVTSTAVDKNNNKWFCTYGEGIAKFKGK